MAPTPLQQRRTHNNLLFQKLLNLREGASPFTLILDTLEQSSGPVVREFARRAKISKTKIIFISFTTLRRKVPFEISNFIAARKKSLSVLRDEVLSHLRSSTQGQTTPPSNTTIENTKHLIIIDTLQPLSSAPNASHLSSFLSSLLISPSISLLATYHTDIPIPFPSSSSYYAPTPLQTLSYLATAILTLTALTQTLASKRALDRSLPAPVFGLEECKEGILVSLSRSSRNQSGKLSSSVQEAPCGVGVVITMNLRRRSGRGVVETFVLSPSASSTTASSAPEITLLDDHPLYSLHPLASVSSPHGDDAQSQSEMEMQSTFNLSLTEKQKRDREAVILPYFDAQNRDAVESGVIGDGGRILYQMGSEDREDFDDEEDEI